MAEDTSEKRAGFWLKLTFRAIINVALVLFLSKYFESFFVIAGGFRAIAIVGLTLTVLNWLVVPLLHVLSLPIKLFAWVVSFLLVNAAALYLTTWFITALAVDGVTLSIGGGFVGWIVVSIILGIGNWLVKVIVK